MKVRLGGAVALLALGVACLPTTPLARTVVPDAAFPAAVALHPDGGFLYGERLTGRIRIVDARGTLRAASLAELEVSTDGQRGLLGLAVTGDGAVYAAWTRPDLRLAVGRVTRGALETVWVGPETVEQGNGGRIALGPDGGLVIGIGDLLDPSRVEDPDAPNGKLLRLDPNGPEDQIPQVISMGWNNPFALTFTPDGELWVADNSPGRQPERLARGDLEDLPARVTDLPDRTAPSGLAARSGTELVVCGYLSRQILPFRVGLDGFARLHGRPLALDCGLEVVVLPDGRLLYTNEEAVRTVRP